MSDTAPTALPRFTLFTAAYNRPDTLERLYDSIVRQDERSLEWIVIDDGSGPAIGQTIDRLQARGEIDIVFQRQRNAHKKTAYNRAIALARGRYFIVMDDDDEFMPGALSALYREWQRIEALPASPRPVGAVAARCCGPDGAMIGMPLQPLPEAAAGDLIGLYFRLHARWPEMIYCMRTDTLLPYRYPEDVPHYVPEAVVWFPYAERHAFRFLDLPLRRLHPTTQSVGRAGKTIARIAATAPGMYVWYRLLLRYAALHGSRRLARLRLQAQCIRFQWHTHIHSPRVLDGYPPAGPPFMPIPAAFLGSLMFIGDFFLAAKTLFVERARRLLHAANG